MEMPGAEPRGLGEVPFARVAGTLERGQARGEQEGDVPAGLRLRQPGHLGGLGTRRPHQVVHQALVGRHGPQHLEEHVAARGQRHLSPAAVVAAAQRRVRTLVPGAYRRAAIRCFLCVTAK